MSNQAEHQQPAPKKPRLVFTDLQRRTLQAIFKVSIVISFYYPRRVLPFDRYPYSVKQPTRFLILTESLQYEIPRLSIAHPQPPTLSAPTTLTND